jgi:hypothetical protein
MTPEQLLMQLQLHPDPVMLLCQLVNAYSTPNSWNEGQILFEQSLLFTAYAPILRENSAHAAVRQRIHVICDVGPDSWIHHQKLTIGAPSNYWLTNIRKYTMDDVMISLVCPPKNDKHSIDRATVMVAYIGAIA